MQNLILNAKPINFSRLAEKTISYGMQLSLQQLLVVFYAACRQVLNTIDYITLLNITFYVGIVMHRHITAFFATSRTPVSGPWSTGSRTGKSEITVRVPVL